MRFPRLTRVSVGVTGSWGSRRYVTRVTGKDEEYLVWRFEFTFSASVLLRAIFLVSQGEVTRWARSHGSVHSIVGPPEQSLRVPLTFRPLHPMSTAEVDVSFGYPQVRTTSEALKADAREVIQPADGQVLFTGEVSDLATIPGASPALARILLLDASDTEDARLHKWRMRRGIRDAAPPELSFLSSGYQRGDIATSLIDEDQPAS